MKKITIILSIVLIIGVFGYMRFFSNEPMVSPLSSLSHPTGVAATITPVQQQTMTSIFVPYWSFTTKKIDTKDLDIIIYFGISADENGIDKTDAGYTKLSQFNKLLPAQTETLLTVRMIDSEFNSKLLEDKKLQEKIILESIALAKEHNFSGIVLDFEINALAFDSVIKNISSLYIRYSKEVKANNLTFSVTLYGDTFYRARPYDVEEIVKHADHIYIMTYDYHKARGNPGPNFPLSGKETYGYDLATMVDDFGKTTTLEKVTIVFGLFGYDWVIDEKKQSVALGEPLSYLKIKQDYITSCSQKDCVIKRDTASAETEISYTDAGGKKHTIWFEDLESIEKKKVFLKEKGINATSLWAYSYY